QRTLHAALQKNSAHPYADLAAEQQMLELRKQNIRRFGANWLRPAGVAKTLQGMAEEKAEREEAEAMRAREVALEESRLAAEMDEEGAGEEGEQEEEGRDLDEDVPDLDAVGEDDDEDGEEEEGEEGEEEEDGWTENETPVRSPGSEEPLGPFPDDDPFGLVDGRIRVEVEGDGDYADPPPPPMVTGTRGLTPGQRFRTPIQRFHARSGRGVAAADGRGGEGAGFVTPIGRPTASPGNVVDLDAEIPEAVEGGSYEHTDTEVEEVSSNDGDWMAPTAPARNISRRQAGRGGEVGFTTPGMDGAGGQTVGWQGNSGGYSGGGVGEDGSFLSRGVFGSSPVREASASLDQMGAAVGNGIGNAGASTETGGGRSGMGREN
ncbi:MAG: hypothetical protein Q9163_006533, partial [Psora crenata]